LDRFALPQNRIICTMPLHTVSFWFFFSHPEQSLRPYERHVDAHLHAAPARDTSIARPPLHLLAHITAPRPLHLQPRAALPLCLIRTHSTTPLELAPARPRSTREPFRARHLPLPRPLQAAPSLSLAATSPATRQGSRDLHSRARSRERVMQNNGRRRTWPTNWSAAVTYSRRRLTEAPCRARRRRASAGARAHGTRRGHIPAQQRPSPRVNAARRPRGLRPAKVARDAVERLQGRRRTELAAAASRRSSVARRGHIPAQQPPAAHAGFALPRPAQPRDTPLRPRAEEESVASSGSRRKST
jgi:hypothetical protein